MKDRLINFYFNHFVKYLKSQNNYDVVMHVINSRHGNLDKYLSEVDPEAWIVSAVDFSNTPFGGIVPRDLLDRSLNVSSWAASSMEWRTKVRQLNLKRQQQ